MTVLTQDEAIQLADEVLTNPALAPFIQELPSGEKALPIEAVKGILASMIIKTDEAMKSMLDMIKNAGQPFAFTHFTFTYPNPMSNTSFSTTGTISHIFDERQVSDKFRLQEFAITIADGQYPQTVKFQVTNDKIDLLSPYGVGQEVEVNFNLRGREYEKNGTTTVFNTLDAWKIQPAGQTQQQAPAQQSANRNPALRAGTNAAAPIASDDDNDLPF